MRNEIQSDLARHGLALLGGFAPSKEDALPEAAPGKAARTVLLAGNAGSGFWAHFAAAPEYADGKPDPLNRWSARVIAKIAGNADGRALFPFEGPPWWPFQQWGLRAGGAARSPLGVLVRHDYGPWFAFRAAILLPEPVSPPPLAETGPCEACADKPCLDACPAAAITRAKPFYDADTCRAYVRENPQGPCALTGCQVRHACPYGRDYAYAPGQARFHMKAFVT